MKFSKHIISFVLLAFPFLLAANDFTPIVTQFNKKDYTGAIRTGLWHKAATVLCILGITWDCCDLTEPVSRFSSFPL